jgi:hypothetical protein
MPRDDSVSDAIWQQLLADKQAAERAAKALENETRQAKQKLQQAIQDEERKRAAVRPLHMPKQSPKMKQHVKKQNVSARSMNEKSKQREWPDRNWRLHCRPRGRRRKIRNARRTRYRLPCVVRVFASKAISGSNNKMAIGAQEEPILFTTRNFPFDQVQGIGPWWSRWN